MKNLKIYELFLIIFCYSEFNSLMSSQALNKLLTLPDDTIQGMPYYSLTLSLDAVNEELKRAEAICDFISYYPWIEHGFKILPHHDVQIDSFYQMVDKLLVTDILDENDVEVKDGFEFIYIIDKVKKELFEHMKEPFFEALTDALKKNQDNNQLNWYFLHHIYHHQDMHIDQIFHYVLHFKKSYMKDVVDTWINDWFKNSGELSLHMMIKPENINKILVLLNLPIEISQVDNQDKNLLLMAMENENIQLIEAILERIKDNPISLDFAVNQFDNKGLTPLDYAVMRNNKQIVEILLQAGAVIGHQNGFINPLHRAIVYGYEEIINQLLWSDPKIIDVRDDMNRTPLYLALFNNGLDLDAQKKYQRIIQKLLSFGATVNTFCNGYAPLHLAVGYGYYDIAKVLLEDGADPNVTVDNLGIETSLFSIIKFGSVSIDMVKLLLEHGAEVNDDIDSQGISIWEYAINYPDVLELLLQNDKKNDEA